VPITAVETVDYNNRHNKNQSNTWRKKNSINKYAGSSSKQSDRSCHACGKEYPHIGDCPARGRRCAVCKELNHFAKSKYCRKKINAIATREPTNFEDANDGSDTDNEKASTLTDDENEDHNKYIFTLTDGTDNRPTIELFINDRPVKKLIGKEHKTT
jgi:hypothetical protein